MAAAFSGRRKKQRTEYTKAFELGCATAHLEHGVLDSSDGLVLNERTVGKEVVVADVRCHCVSVLVDGPLARY